MGRKKPPQDPDALLQSLLAEADPMVLARFTGQAPVHAAASALDRLGAGEVVTLETSLAVGEMDILDDGEAGVDSAPPVPVSEPDPDPEADAVTAEAELPAPPPPPNQTIRADGLPVAVVDLWGDLDESSPPASAPPSLDDDLEEDS